LLWYTISTPEVLSKTAERGRDDLIVLYYPDLVIGGEQGVNVKERYLLPEIE